MSLSPYEYFTIGLIFFYSMSLVWVMGWAADHFKEND